MTAHKPMTPADHIARAKSEALAGDASYAVAHALIAIAELLVTNPVTSDPKIAQRGPQPRESASLDSDDAGNAA